MILTKEGIDNSAQHAETLAIWLAVEKTIQEGHKHIYICNNSQCSYNAVTISPSKWKKNNWQICGKDIWSNETCAKISESK